MSARRASFAFLGVAFLLLAAAVLVAAREAPSPRTSPPSAAEAPPGAAAATRADPPRSPPRAVVASPGGGDDRRGILAGGAIVDVVNRRAAANANATATATAGGGGGGGGLGGGRPRLSTCAAGFADVGAVRAAACAAKPNAASSRTTTPSPPPSSPSPSPPPSVDWNLLDATYAALADAPDALALPSGCVFGCVPLGRDDVAPLQRVAATLPWHGKCFSAPRRRDVLVHPTKPTGGFPRRVANRTVTPLLARVKNRVERPPGAAADDDGEEGGFSAPSSAPSAPPPAASAQGSSRRLVAPARAYVGASAFDSKPAIVVDYAGADSFGSFRDELRYASCGVWIGKTYLAGSAEKLAQSLARAGGVDALNPVIEKVIERAVPKPPGEGEPLPHVLDFVLFRTAPGAEEE